MFKKLITIVLTSVVAFSLTDPPFATKAKASDLNAEDLISNNNINVITSSENQVDLTLEGESGDVKLSVEKLNANTTKATLIDVDGETYEFTSYADSGEIYLDGEIAATIEKFQNPDAEIYKEPENSTFASSTPVYVYSHKINYSKTFSSFSGATTIAGILLGFVTIASLTVFPVSKKALQTNLATWLSGVLGVSGITGFTKGYWSYDLYRTKDQFYTPYSGYQYKYRYQNTKVSFTFAGNTFYKSYTQVGDWWYQYRPY